MDVCLAPRVVRTSWLSLGKQNHSPSQQLGVPEQRPQSVVGSPAGVPQTRKRKTGRSGSEYGGSSSPKGFPSVKGFSLAAPEPFVCSFAHAQTWSAFTVF